MNGLVYARYELLRTVRNRRFYIVTFALPLVLYYAIAGPSRHVTDLQGSGISAPLYYMVSLATFGCMNGALAGGARIAAERATGWNRQLRLTALTTRNYFRVKVATTYLTVITTILLLYAAGATLGVTLEAGTWVEMTLLILVGIVPFAALGILAGHLFTPDSIGPAIGGTTAILALLGGVWFPISSSGFLHDLAIMLPSYWLVQAAHVGIGGKAWGPMGWAVVVGWSVTGGLLAAAAYQRDTKKV